MKIQQLHFRQTEKGFMAFTSPKEYEQFLTERDLLDDERKELIKDLEYFIDYKKFRRPELWTEYVS